MNYEVRRVCRVEMKRMSDRRMAEMGVPSKERGAPLFPLARKPRSPTRSFLSSHLSTRLPKNIRGHCVYGPCERAAVGDGMLSPRVLTPNYLQ